MKVVVQEDAMGCGIACVASILGISYKHTLKLLPNGKLRAETKGFSPKDLSEVLSLLGTSYTRKHLKVTPKTYPTGSIIHLKCSKRFPFAHYIAKTKSGWMDPWINYPKKPRKAGIRKKLPYKGSYLIFPTAS